MREKSARIALIHSEILVSDNKPTAILAVGEPSEWTGRNDILPNSDDMIFVSFKEVSAGSLDYFKPTLILSPALAPAFDCIELAMLLHNIGYKGAYRAVVRDLPNPNLIEREVKSTCPLLDFGILKVE